jgi:hypothetical protein
VNDNQTPIDWSILHRAQAFYGALGYTYTDVPWSVPEQIANITFDGGGFYSAGLGILVGSGEQGLLTMKLPEGRYLTITPCWRTEEPSEICDATRFYFMKAELYSVELYPDYTLLLNDALAFHRDLGIDCTVVETEDGCDIMAGDLELGSYGARTHQWEADGVVHSHNWVYGTGVALPRASIARPQGVSRWL